MMPSWFFIRTGVSMGASLSLTGNAPGIGTFVRQRNVTLKTRDGSKAWTLLVQWPTPTAWMSPVLPTLSRLVSTLISSIPTWRILLLSWNNSNQVIVNCGTTATNLNQTRHVVSVKPFHTHYRRCSNRLGIQSLQHYPNDECWWWNRLLCVSWLTCATKTRHKASQVDVQWKNLVASTLLLYFVLFVI